MTNAGVPVWSGSEFLSFSVIFREIERRWIPFFPDRIRVTWSAQAEPGSIESRRRPIIRGVFRWTCPDSSIRTDLHSRIVYKPHKIKNPDNDAITVNSADGFVYV